jgi:hypothetical protein
MSDCALKGKPNFVAHHDGDDVLEDLERARQHRGGVGVEHGRLERQRAQLMLAVHLQQKQQQMKSGQQLQPQDEHAAAKLNIWRVGIVTCDTHVLIQHA